MKNLIVTRQRVQAVVNELVAQGQRVSVRNVQAKLGGGNNTVIGKMLGEFLSQSPNEDSQEVVTLRQRVKELSAALANTSNLPTDQPAPGGRVWVDANGVNVVVKDQSTFDAIPGYADSALPIQQKTFQSLMAGKPVAIKFLFSVPKNRDS